MDINKFGTTPSQTFTDINGRETNNTYQNGKCCLSWICSSIISVFHYFVCEECCCLRAIAN